MATYRNIQMSFWTDPKVVEEFTPEDRYFYLYIMTNPFTKLSGCYEISIKRMALDLGYTADVVERLLKRFHEIHKVCVYDYSTHELLILNWHKYNWTSSEKFLGSLLVEVDSIKNAKFRDYIVELIQNGSASSDMFFEDEDTLYIPYQYPNDTVSQCSSLGKGLGIGLGISNNINIESEFEKMWALYPRKKGKVKVSTTQKKKLISIGTDHIIRCVKRYSKEMENKSPEYIMHGSTFFNSGYVDYLDENYEETKSSASVNTNNIRAMLDKRDGVTNDAQSV